MRRTVTRKQPNSRMCLVCGLRNDLGLRSFFYELDNRELLAIFRPLQAHQSYPGLLHGGIATAILDETIGRAIMIAHQDDLWGVTVELAVRFKKHIPLGEELRVISRITSENKRLFEGTGELLLEDGSVAAEGRGKYMKQSLAKIGGFDPTEQEWRTVPSDKDPQFVNI